MARLTTHVLDISAGAPAAGVRIEVHGSGPCSSDPLLSTSTGADGRCLCPLLAGDAFHTGRFTLTFHLGEYFRLRGISLPEPAFIEQAVIQIGIADASQHYHVPLLISPWSYSVYRGG